MIYGHKSREWKYWWAWRPVKLKDGRHAWWHGLARCRNPGESTRYRPWEEYVAEIMNVDRFRDSNVVPPPTSPSHLGSYQPTLPWAREYGEWTRDFRNQLERARLKK
jgi:hypothetical protein